jgi:endonuclease YncB( thermonuclease family)
MSLIRSHLGRYAVGLSIAVGALAGTTVGTAHAAEVTRARARVTSWVDGDTVHTTKGTVRLIGMDTPERGRECYGTATRSAKLLAPVGSRVTLVRVLGRNNVDRYGRKLRYVQHAGVDVGLRQIKRGLADARYDSRDGYGSHPRQATYRRADAAHPDRECGSTPPPPPPPSGNCDPAYSPCVPPPPPDLNCADIGHAVSVNHAYGDPHNFDADGDGRGCESYG